MATFFSVEYVPLYCFSKVEERERILSQSESGGMEN